ncbi:HAD family hydrolase [Actinoplanes sp. LDG1-06]|uniref:HAD family hydrolase n=1 Tax=Paractinoplanes ovalisporus TaxID=2810368 RepID=A0ABS2AVC8_9ACTN|nr:HAD family hydrolase [Actinoplanes ovalisporus]MBM2623104.1 HAD family hydrolase [Actinoplanes ovalisporus]
MRPAAILLDFGGVLADAPPQRTAPPGLVLRIFNLTHGTLTPGEIQRSLTEGAVAYAAWRDEDWPDELSQAEVWERFILPGWPPAAQVPVRGAVRKLSYEWAWRDTWALRPGIPEALHAAHDAGIVLAVVSNTLSGSAHRDFLDKSCLGDLFATQIYSDEAGVRKPNPQMIWNATDELGLDPAACWFVGDTPRRDIVCGRRAGIGRAVLMPSPRTRSEPGGPTPDDTVEDGFGLLTLIEKNL